MPEHVYRYPVVRPMDPHELRRARLERLRAAAPVRPAVAPTAPVLAAVRPPR